MEQENIVTFLATFTKKDLFELEPSINFHTKKALFFTILFTLFCILALLFRKYLLGLILFVYSIYGVFRHLFSIKKFYDIIGKKDAEETITLVDNKFATLCPKLKIDENYLNTVERIIETKNLLVIITSNTFLPIKKSSLCNVSLSEFKTFLLNNCPNLLDKKINYFIKFPKYYLILTIIIYICGLLSTILYFI